MEKTSTFSSNIYPVNLSSGVTLRSFSTLDACFDDFLIFWKEMQKIYCNKNLEFNAAIKCMANTLEAANELGQINTNSIKGN